MADRAFQQEARKVMPTWHSSRGRYQMHSKPRKKERLTKALEEEKSDTMRAHRGLLGQGQGLCVDSSTGLKEDND